MEKKAIFGGLICMATCLVIVFILPQTGLSIADFVIGAQHKDATCDVGAVVSLSTWLFITGSIGLAFVIVLVITFIIVVVLGFTKPELLPFPLVPLVILIIVFSLFNLAWNIVGAVALFRDSMECLNSTKSLWGLTLANLILQWLSIAYTVFGGSGSARIGNKND